MGVYNEEAKRLRKAVESVAAQTYPCRELLIVDDGSSDEDTLKELQKLQEIYPWVQVLHKENGGISSARNAGVTRASGDYILFLDGDDELCPEILEQFAAVIRQGDEPIRPDAVLANYQHLDEETGGTEPCQPFKESAAYDGKEEIDGLTAEIYQKLVYSCMRGCFLRKTVSDHGIHFPEGILVCEDVDWLLQILLCSRHVRTLNANMCIYHSFPKPRKERYRRYESQVLVSEHWIREMEKENYDAVLRRTLTDLFAKLYVAFSLQIPAMPDPEERKKAQKLCRDHLWIAERGSNRYAKLFHLLCSVFGVRMVTSMYGLFR